MKWFVVSLLACSAAFAAPQAPVGPALERPAAATRQAHRSVLLGAALAGTRLVAVGERGIVLVSEDQGARWEQVPVPVSVTLTAVRFADERHGWSVGHGGVILHTQDGGRRWVKQFDGIAAARLLLDDAQKRGAGVAQAQRLVAEGADKPFFDLHFFDARRGIVVGAYNLAFSTQDGGQTWQPFAPRLDNPKALHLYAVRARGNTVLIAGEQGLVLRSEDAGKTFKRLTTPYAGSFFTAELPADGNLVVAGLRGNVWRSRDGLAWTSVATPVPVSFTASAAAGGDTLLANQGGALFRLDAAGVEPLPVPAGAPVTALLPLRESRLLVLGLRGASVLVIASKP